MKLSERDCVNANNSIDLRCGLFAYYYNFESVSRKQKKWVPVQVVFFDSNLLFLEISGVRVRRYKCCRKVG